MTDSVPVKQVRPSDYTQVQQRFASRKFTKEVTTIVSLFGFFIASCFGLVLVLIFATSSI